MISKKIRVLHLLHSLGVGGAERRVLRLGRGLDADRYDVHALTLRPSLGSVLPWPSERHTYFSIPPGIQVQRLFALSRFMRDGGYEIVHSHNWATMFYGVLGARLARVPVVLHGEHGRNDADRAGIPLRRELLAAALSRMATQVVAVNESIAADVQARWKLTSKNIVCLPNGVDLGRFVPRVTQKTDSDEYVIGTIARFDGIKNLPCLIQAFEQLHASHPSLNIRLILVGAGPELDVLSRLVRDSNSGHKIQLVGETDSPESWYQQFDLYANTSFSEGMSNSILEAMACGLPIVASAIAGNLCWLHGEKNALFFPSDNPSALAAILGRFASDRSFGRRMGVENLRRVKAEYDNQHFLRRYDDMYQRLLSRR